MARVKYLTVARGERLHIENYPSFHKSGSIKGMKEKYYGKMLCLCNVAVISTKFRREYMTWQSEVRLWLTKI